MTPALNSVFEQVKYSIDMKKDITELYSFIDDFCKIYLKRSILLTPEELIDDRIKIKIVTGAKAVHISTLLP